LDIKLCTRGGLEEYDPSLATITKAAHTLARIQNKEFWPILAAAIQTTKIYNEVQNEKNNNDSSGRLIMGADSFFNSGLGDDPKTIFKDLVKKARHEYGNGGYTGTIAEKTQFKIVSQLPMPKSYWKSDEAQQKYGEGEKWGPALAAPYCVEIKTGLIIGWVFWGWASG
jgi:hypothetical protein